ncbi:hypothetical protein KR038_006716 [Drosophila bunnanda]|nr:hypothetical protein KR038_006716 [Drosophila bunnanda]
MNGSAANQQQPLSVPQNGPVVYDSGIVFGGNVYPVLIDGVPIQPPAGAHQAAVQQRMQMQSMQQTSGDHQLASQQRMQMHQGLQAPHPRQNSPKPLPALRGYQQIDAPTGSTVPSTSQQQRPFNNQQLQLQQPLQQQVQQQVQQPMRQQQQLQAMGGSYGSSNFNYNHQPNAGGDFFGEWNGYAMWQPTDVNKSYAIGWSPF